MIIRSGLAAVAAAVFAAAALGAADPRHLIDDRGVISASGVKGPYVCNSFPFCKFTEVDVRTEDWTDRTGSLHKDGCTARWDYSGFDVDGMSMLRWKINPKDAGQYYFHPVDGVILDPDQNDRRFDLDQEGYFTGSDTFKWFDFNRRTRRINFDYRIYRVRGANGAAGPELCGSYDPVIFNRG